MRGQARPHGVGLLRRAEAAEEGVVEGHDQGVALPRRGVARRDVQAAAPETTCARAKRHQVRVAAAAMSPSRAAVAFGAATQRQVRGLRHSKSAGPVQGEGGLDGQLLEQAGRHCLRRLQGATRSQHQVIWQPVGQAAKSELQRHVEEQSEVCTGPCCFGCWRADFWLQASAPVRTEKPALRHQCSFKLRSGPSCQKGVCSKV